jgi:hypothetical protein
MNKREAMASRSSLFLVVVESRRFSAAALGDEACRYELPGILAGAAGDGEALVRDRQPCSTPSFSRAF